MQKFIIVLFYIFINLFTSPVKAQINILELKWNKVKSVEHKVYRREKGSEVKSLWYEQRATFNSEGELTYFEDEGNLDSLFYENNLLKIFKSLNKYRNNLTVENYDYHNGKLKQIITTDEGRKWIENYFYDQKGVLTSKVQMDDKGDTVSMVRYVYNRNGKPFRIIYGHPVVTSVDTFYYDKKGRVIQTRESYQITSFKYDQKGRIIEKSIAPNFYGQISTPTVYQFSYDDQDRVVGKIEIYPPSYPPVDASSENKELPELVPGPTWHNVFEYDRLSNCIRIVRSCRDYKEEYVCDYEIEYY